MIGALARKIFGSSNERRVKGYQPRVAQINALEKELEKLSDEQLRARAEEFRKQYADGVSLDDLLVPAFATVREAGKRTLGQRHFDVQLIGGMNRRPGAPRPVEPACGPRCCGLFSGLVPNPIGADTSCKRRRTVPRYDLQRPAVPDCMRQRIVIGRDAIDGAAP